MQRRRFFHALAAVPAAPVLFSQQQSPANAPAAAPAQVPAGGRGGRGGRGGGGFGQSAIPKFELTASETVADPTPRFFTSQQFAALRKLSEVMVPPMHGNPGAIECGAPEFLDFLIGVSPAERQRVYRNGLDNLNLRARRQFNKAFADLDAKQADTIIRPLLVAVPWVHDSPKDPNVRFVTEAHRDIRQATQNSREYAISGGGGGGRRGGGGGFGGGGAYLNPIDPVYKS